MEIEGLSEKARLEKLLFYENELWQSGKLYLAGIDEAGRGPLAGPVVAAAVIMPKEDAVIFGVDDSKKISFNKRTSLEIEIKRKALCYAVASASPAEIDEINILQATKLAMSRAVSKLQIRPEHLLIDALKLEDVHIPQTPIIKGDSLSFSIAAASILAKCARDRIMQEFDKIFPQYGFAKHKGYPTKEHYQAIAAFGASPIHRKSFRLE